MRELSRRGFMETFGLSAAICDCVTLEGDEMGPPVLCGLKPFPINRLDRRWILAKDGDIDIPISAPGRFTKVNELVNQRVAYMREPVDRWASPQETWRQKKGDCEDFAILKRAILKASGIPDEDLFFMLAFDAARREQHSFLIARQGPKAYILDVPVGLVTMYPVEKATDFRPWVAFTGSNAWAYA